MRTGDDTEALGLQQLWGHRMTHLSIVLPQPTPTQRGKVALKRLLIIGALAAASAFTFAISANANPGQQPGGQCSPSYTGGNLLLPTAVPLPIYTGGDQNAGEAGIGSASDNFLEVRGGLTSKSATVAGSNNADIAPSGDPAPIPKSGVNGSTTVGAGGASTCEGDTRAAQGVHS